MYSRGSTATPAPARRHEALSERVTWVNDWYTPDMGSGDGSIPSELKLKGWYRVSSGHTTQASLQLSQDDSLSLQNHAYMKTVEEEQQPTEVKSDLGTAMSMKSEEGQISGLGMKS
ncbi:uncharacterized protein KQ657_004371 [Scheffersomyces spartinae]|uniref:Uncharacterized protein n=1 Tax=Scheffersomyces spartinae TaxID=45513 RepID=A0A9P7VCA5_9ASCO|nr:uncharacterized protein KQ657_004371 [Scheffersomyces spartinae]KAG7194694.1 hypothetical protein KQ657_004371 [Scheffersomyces spartinae]